MFNKLKLPIIGLVIALAVVATAAWSAQGWFGRGAGGNAEASTLNSDASSPSGIWVNGNGTVSVKPDLAIVSMGVQADGKTVAEARDKAAAAMQAVIDALKALGISENDIQTQYFSIQPKYTYRQITKCPDAMVLPPEVRDPSFPPEKLPYVAGCWQEGQQVLEGYTVSNQVTVKVRNLNNLSQVVDNAATAGGDVVRMNGVNFTVENDGAAREKAREAAVKEAIAKAQQYAQLTGVTLGKVQYINETGYSTPMAYRSLDAYAKGEAAYSAPMPISSGELDVTASVQMVFAIQ
jgi:hypothetical protein